MITNISRQLTTGALAIAGSVAAFGFAGAAPVQAQEECLPQSFNNFKTNPCRKGDKLFTHINSSGIGITGLPPYRNTKKSTKPLLHGASQKKLTSRYWVHFSLENGCTVDCIWSRAIP